jgi:hypothetical protein
MNELIQKLAEESGLDARTMGFQNNHTEQWNARVSKLTQLIVKECVAICQDIDGEDSSDGRCARQDCSVEIREHFGVEE